MPTTTMHRYCTSVLLPLWSLAVTLVIKRKPGGGGGGEGRCQLLPCTRVAGMTLSNSSGNLNLLTPQCRKVLFCARECPPNIQKSLRGRHVLSITAQPSSHTALADSYHVKDVRVRVLQNHDLSICSLWCSPHQGHALKVLSS